MERFGAVSIPFPPPDPSGQTPNSKIVATPENTVVLENRLEDAENPHFRAVFTSSMTPLQLTDWIDTHAAALTLFARQHCADPEAVVQEAFCKLMQLRTSAIDPAAWLYKVVRNGAIDAGKAERRRRKREAMRAIPEVWFDETSLGGIDAEEAVHALTALPAEQREVIVLRIWSGLNLEQIAAACGCSVSSVHRRYEAGLQTLRERLGAPWPTM